VSLGIAPPGNRLPEVRFISERRPLLLRHQLAIGDKAVTPPAGDNSGGELGQGFFA
jgi:hypothetical protein